MEQKRRMEILSKILYKLMQDKKITEEFSQGHLFEVRRLMLKEIEKENKKDASNN